MFILEGGETETSTCPHIFRQECIAGNWKFKLQKNQDKLLPILCHYVVSPDPRTTRVGIAQVSSVTRLYWKMRTEMVVILLSIQRITVYLLFYVKRYLPWCRNLVHEMLEWYSNHLVFELVPVVIVKKMEPWGFCVNQCKLNAITR